MYQRINGRDRCEVPVKKNIIIIKKGDPAEIVLHLGECLEVRTYILETTSLEGCFAGVH